MTLERSLCEAFQATSSVFPDRTALRSSDGSTVVTWREYAERVRKVAAGLTALGVKPGDTVAIMLTNRPEFHIVDTGALHLGATPFSIYNTLSPDQITYLFGNAGNTVVITEQQFVDTLRAANTDGQVQHVVCVDGKPEGTTTLAELEASGDPGFDFDTAWKAVEPDATATIIYTSGTTGPPKGVELTHANMLSEIHCLEEIMPTSHDDSVISYLPDAHVANRWGAHYTNLVKGLEIITVADPKQLIATLPQARPTFFGAVPAVWYKVKAAIEAQVAAEPDAKKQKIARWALATGQKVAWAQSDRKPVGLRLKVEHALADKLVLSKIRDKMGLDRVRVSASGASAIAPEALAFMRGLGLPVCEVWGMSETSAIVTLNRPDDFKIGTVGKVVPGMEVRIADDGELLCRGPLLMKGYRNDPEKTAEAIDADGWMHTGDIAVMDDDGFVKIVDRKKELIINSGGKNMSPANIEGAVKVNVPLAGSIVAIGDDRPYVTALLTLDPDACAAYAARVGLEDASPATLATDPGVLALVEQGVKAANEKLSRVEQVKKWKLLPTAWEPGSEELTPTMKLKRKPIAEKYAAEIEALYER